MWRNLLNSILLSCCLLVAAGCNSVPVAQDLDQGRANKVVALLDRHGIGALSEKARGGRGQYTVTVRRGHYHRAQDLLAQSGLLERSEPEMSDLLKDNCFVPATREKENLRLDYAKGLELSRHLRENSGIVSASAVVSYYSVKEGQQPGAHIILVLDAQHAAGAGQAPIDRDRIIDAAEKALPGIERKNISIVESIAQPVEQKTGMVGVVEDGHLGSQVPLVKFFYKWHVPEGEHYEIALVFLFLLVTAGFVGGVLGYFKALSQAPRNVFTPVGEEPSVASLGFERGGNKTLPEG